MYIYIYIYPSTFTLNPSGQPSTPLPPFRCLLPISSRQVFMINTRWVHLFNQFVPNAVLQWLIWSRCVVIFIETECLSWILAAIRWCAIPCGRCISRSFSKSLICTGARWNPAAVRTNQGNWKKRCAPPLGADDLANHFFMRPFIGGVSYRSFTSSIIFLNSTTWCVMTDHAS